MNQDITLREATREDVPLVAWAVLTALDMPTDDMEEILASCADEKSMYSWCNSLIACVGGMPVGCIVSYDGDHYEEVREYTWSRLWDDFDREEILNTPAETHPGEYYLDTMAIKAEARGRDIGKMLMLAAIERGKSLGYNRFSLIVDINKPRLKKYYETLGFQKSGEILFFGHNYYTMTKVID